MNHKTVSNCFFKFLSADQHRPNPPNPHPHPVLRFSITCLTRISIDLASIHHELAKGVTLLGEGVFSEGPPL